MTDLLTAAKAAIARLEKEDKIARFPNNAIVINNLRAAIEEAEKAEPVAWMKQWPPGRWEQCSRSHGEAIPVYSHPAPTIPEEWQLVPKEPTYEMFVAFDNAGGGDWYISTMLPVYRAMLAAAPEYEGERK